MVEASQGYAAHQDITAYLAASCRYFGLPRLALAIVTQGSETEVFETPLHRSSPAVYKVGSLTKLVTALAVLQLQDQGTLKLSDALSRHLPWFRPPSHASTRVLDLLLHTSGLPRGELFKTNPSAEEIERSVSGLTRPSTPPENKRVRYSNLGYTLLGLLIEAVTGESYAEFVRRFLFAPLGMRHSGFGTQCEGQAITTPHQVSCFMATNVTPYDVDEMALYSAPHASLDMFSTVADFSRLLSCLLNDGVLAGQRILSSRIVSALLRTAYPANGRLKAGLGVNVLTAPDGHVLFENGEHFGHSAAMRILPGKGFAAIAMTNRGSAALDLSPIVDAVSRYSLGDRATDALRHAYADPSALVGSYQLSSSSSPGSASTGSVSSLTIAADEEGLLAAVDEEPQAPLIYKGQNCFVKLAGSHSRYAIRLERQDGSVHGLCVGPLYFTKRPFASAAPAAPSHSAIVGIYRNPAVGRVALFERNRQLILSYSPFKEAILQQLGPTSFVQKSGPFTNEEVAIDMEQRTLQLGELRFAATGEHY